MIDAINANVGDYVETIFTGWSTTHRITDRAIGQSQTRVMFKVTPPVPRSSGGWIDSAWFRMAEGDSK